MFDDDIEHRDVLHVCRKPAYSGQIVLVLAINRQTTGVFNVTADFSICLQSRSNTPTTNDVVCHHNNHVKLIHGNIQM